jgi:glucosamine--fructose-6-phosphate aminotransferase (isomerizing)
MCGIIGYTGARDAATLLLDGLRRLEYRGYDSAGIAVVDPDRPTTQTVRCEGKIGRLAAQLKAAPLSGRCGIGHTRWATHGRPSETNAHPHRQGKVSIVHNGIIENHLELRDNLTAAGRTFDSETDTEIFAHLVDRALEQGATDLHRAVRAALANVRGTWALCVLHDDAKDEIVVARHGAPLLIGFGASGPETNGPGPEMFVASDVAAILAHTRVVTDLEDGDVAQVVPNGVVIHDASGDIVDRPKRRIDWSPVAAEKQGYKHFMLKEIHEQPTAISDTLMGRISLEQADVSLDGLDLHLPPGGRIVMVACGTSFHAALAGKYLTERLARIPVEVDLASEFRYREPIIGKADLVVAISQSGETADTLAALTEAKRLGARSLAVCNVIDSSIARASDDVVYTHAGPEISVASTKAFVTQLTVLTLLAVYLGKRANQLDDGRVREVLEGLSAIPEAMNGQLGRLSTIKTIARRHAGAHNFLFLGRGLGFPVALEGALKLKELSYIHAEGYASGEMKHGPIALVDEDVPVVVVALRGPGYEKVLSNLEEVRARGGRIIALATEGDRRIGDLADDVILVPDVDEILQPVLATLPLQAFAYFTADIKGTDVDQPRNLAKSVTVE